MEGITMKIMKTNREPIILSLIFTGLLCISGFMVSCTGLMADNKVNDAYELRMSGHADSALIVLNETIIAEPGNAAAYYERARAKKHMMLGAGGYDISEIIADASKACELDPENAIYSYFEANVKFLDVYIDVMRGQEEIEDKLETSFASFENTLNIKACYPAVLITLTEINAWFPEEMGGDWAKAENYASKLEACNPVEGLKAKAFLLPEDGDLVKYWLDIYEAHDANAIISEELGRAYLLNGDTENGKKYIEEAVSLNPEKSIILIDLGRATMMNAMQSQDKVLAEDALIAYQKYLDASPDAPGPIKAYTYGMMAQTCKRIIGNDALADEYMEKKDTLDPFCSRASGAPSEGLFTPPDVLPKNTVYYSRPF
jgi:tetratricopeptide (TPR) repeat protein